MIEFTVSSNYYSHILNKQENVDCPNPIVPFYERKKRGGRKVGGNTVEPCNSEPGM